MTACTFAGHREVFGMDARSIETVLEMLLEQEEELRCYVGGMGEFDLLAAAAVRGLKRKYPHKQITLILVLPYLQKRINDNRLYYETSYDDILIPAELAGLHYKQAITACNKWLVDHTDCLIAMVWRNFGGAYRTMRYAQRQGKRVFLLEQ